MYRFIYRDGTNYDVFKLKVHTDIYLLWILDLSIITNKGTHKKERESESDSLFQEEEFH